VYDVTIQVTLRSIRLCFVRFGFGWLVTLRFIKFFEEKKSLFVAK